MQAGKRDAHHLNSVKHWIFDLDGTLTSPIHDFPAIRSTLGLKEGVDILHAIAEVPPQQQQIMHQKLAEIETEIANQSTPIPGVFKLLEKLKSRGDCLGVLTRNTKQHAVISLKKIGLTSFFKVTDILGRHESLPKPEPDGIYKLLDHWQAAPSSTVIVGDHVHDLDAGVAAGICTVHFDTSGQFAWPELATYRVKTLSELSELIN
jgi:HAD superfamily hydrolase (TIGR01509 family)